MEEKIYWKRTDQFTIPIALSIYGKQFVQMRIASRKVQISWAIVHGLRLIWFQQEKEFQKRYGFVYVDRNEDDNAAKTAEMKTVIERTASTGINR